MVTPRLTRLFGGVPLTTSALYRWKGWASLAWTGNSLAQDDLLLHRSGLGLALLQQKIITRPTYRDDP